MIKILQWNHLSVEIFFFLRRVLNYESNFFSGYRNSIQSIHFILVEFKSLCFFRNGPFFLNCPTYEYIFFIVFTIFLMAAVSVMMPSVTILILAFSVFFFFKSVLLEVYQFYFLRPRFQFYWYSLISYFHSYWLLIFIISSLVHVLLYFVLPFLFPWGRNLGNWFETLSHFKCKHLMLQICLVVLL